MEFQKELFTDGKEVKPLPKKGVINFLEHLVERKQTYLKKNLNSSDFRFIDLFAGIGGLRKGFENMEVNVSSLVNGINMLK
ncbi:MAG: hypothetical protein CM15mP29_4220 [Alphaproteobacteria bacterium]|nr:MAG: hypothetical protein CM15mP29_4220 [Alphaproteobacteria bacterium]